MITFKLLIFSVVLVLLIQFGYAESFVNYENAEIDIRLSSDMYVKEVGSNPNLLEAEAVLKLIPLKTDNQEIIDMNPYAEPYADINEEKDKITYLWRDVSEDQISYGVKSYVKVKNMPLRIQKEISYPPSFDEKYSGYIEEKKYIDIDSDIEDLADKIFEDEKGLFQGVYKAAKWIEDNIKYEKTHDTEEHVQRSSWVLKNKMGVCDELTNLFISILRVKKIPARFISGVVYSVNNQKFENHGWAEVYFPQYGWLPFDLTYLEYGWIDATHIKLAESEDSGAASVDYRWKSSDIDIELDKLNIDASFKKLGNKMIPILTAVLEPTKTKVGFGSYVPIKLTIENPSDFYLTPMIFLTKAPQLMDKNKKTLFIKPKEIKNTYYIVKIPAELDEDFVFKADIEAEIAFGDTASTKLEFSSDYPVITKEEAESIISKYKDKDTKKQITTIDFDCSTEKLTYYEDEDVEVICTIKNKEKDAKSLNICLSNDCKSVSASELEEKIIIFKAKSANKVVITAENNDEIKYSTINLDIIKIPSIVIKNIEPLVVDYNEEVKMKIELESVIPSYNVSIHLGEQEILNTRILHGKKEVVVQVKGKDLINGLNFNMVYTDMLNKEYIKTEEYLITVKNKPWYVWIFGWAI